MISVVVAHTRRHHLPHQSRCITQLFFLSPTDIIISHSQLYTIANTLISMRLLMRLFLRVMYSPGPRYLLPRHCYRSDIRNDLHVMYAPYLNLKLRLRQHK
jgi:hypothetical protein